MCPCSTWLGLLLLGTTLGGTWGTDFTRSHIQVLSSHGLEDCLHLSVLHIDRVCWAPCFWGLDKDHAGTDQPERLNQVSSALSIQCTRDAVIFVVPFVLWEINLL